MMLEQRLRYFNPAPFNPGTNAVLGQRPSWNIDRSYPIEEIVIHVGFTVTTALVNSGSPTSPDLFDNILTLVQRATLTINEGKQPRSVVDMSGVGLLEYASQVGTNLDASTLSLIGLSQTGMGIPTGAYQLTYRIPMVHPMIGEPLRTRMFLPVHKFPQDPVLTLQFNTLSGMNFGSGVIGAVFVDVSLVNRVPTAQSEQLLQASAPSDQAGKFRTGYIPFDLLESPFSVAPGVGTEQRLALPIPGQYVTLAFRQYLGGAPLTRNVLDASGIGDTTAHGFGSETRWRLETANVVLREWRWKHLRAINDMTRTAPATSIMVPVAANAFGASTPAAAMNINGIVPNFAGAAIASTNFRAASSSILDFLCDGLSDDTGTELGSLLDANTPATNGLKMEIVGTPYSVATNASYLFVIGHRLFGDLARWQKFQ